MLKIWEATFPIISIYSYINITDHVLAGYIATQVASNKFDSDLRNVAS